MSETYYFERVLPNPLSLIWTPIVPLSFYLVLSPISVTAGIALGLTTFAALLASIWFSAPVIEVTKSQLIVGNATVEKELLGNVTVIEKAEAFAERGPKLSPAAFVKFQPTVSTLIKVELNDPQDPTPYWLFATRKPVEVKKALLR